MTGIVAAVVLVGGGALSPIRGEEGAGNSRSLAAIPSVKPPAVTAATSPTLPRPHSWVETPGGNLPSGKAPWRSGGPAAAGAESAGEGTGAEDREQ